MQGLQVFEPGQQKAGPNTGHKSNQTIADGIRLNLPPPGTSDRDSPSIFVDASGLGESMFFQIMTENQPCILIKKVTTVITTRKNYL